jgi:iron complex transport system permease protein
MSAAVSTTPADDLALGPRHRRRRVGLALALLALCAVVVLSIAIGAKPIPLHDVIHAFTDYDPQIDNHLIVRDQRVPRTLIGIMVGVALGVAGGLMQGLTRNPLADPGLLGVSAGSAFAMTLAVSFLAVTDPLQYVWFAFLGAIVATLVVYGLAAAGGQAGSPVTLALAGVAIGAVLAGLTSTISLMDTESFLTLRIWEAGSLADRGTDVLAATGPFVALGLLLAASAARGLNATALGDELATALGSNVRRTRLEVVVAVTLLCGAATAAVGPIWFVGLMVPHVARWIVGPDQRWMLAYSALLAPTLMLASDVLGRVVVRPDEIDAGIITAFVGGPVLIALIRRSRMRSL